MKTLNTTLLLFICLLTTAPSGNLHRFSEVQRLPSSLQENFASPDEKFLYALKVAFKLDVELAAAKTDEEREDIQRRAVNLRRLIFVNRADRFRELHRGLNDMIDESRPFASRFPEKRKEWESRIGKSEQETESKATKTSKKERQAYMDLIRKTQKLNEKYHDSNVLKEERAEILKLRAKSVRPRVASLHGLIRSLDKSQTMLKADLTENYKQYVEELKKLIHLKGEHTRMKKSEEHTRIDATRALRDFAVQLDYIDELDKRFIDILEEDARIEAEAEAINQALLLEQKAEREAEEINQALIHQHGLNPLETEEQAILEAQRLEKEIDQELKELEEQSLEKNQALDQKINDDVKEINLSIQKKIAEDQAKSSSSDIANGLAQKSSLLTGSIKEKKQSEKAGTEGATQKASTHNQCTITASDKTDSPYRIRARVGASFENGGGKTGVSIQVLNGDFQKDRFVDYFYFDQLNCVAPEQPKCEVSYSALTKEDLLILRNPQNQAERLSFSLSNLSTSDILEFIDTLYQGQSTCQEVEQLRMNMLLQNQDMEITDGGDKAI